MDRLRYRSDSVFQSVFCYGIISGTFDVDHSGDAAVLCSYAAVVQKCSGAAVYAVMLAGGACADVE